MGYGVDGAARADRVPYIEYARALEDRAGL